MSDKSEREELRQHFEHNMLDGDAIQVGQMLSSKEVFEYIAEVVTETREATRQAVLTELLEKAPEDLKASAYTLNMVAPHNPPSNTTRTNLLRDGYNQANAKWREALEKIRREDVWPS
jgi:hypothetical protein